MNLLKLYEAYLEDPSPANRADLGGRAMSVVLKYAGGQGLDVRGAKRIIREETEFLLSKRFTSGDLSQYLRTRRVGMRYPLDRVTRVALFALALVEGDLPLNPQKRASKRAAQSISDMAVLTWLEQNGPGPLPGYEAIDEAAHDLRMSRSDVDDAFIRLDKQRYIRMDNADGMPYVFLRRGRRASQKLAKNVPPDVERYVQEHKDQGADESKAWALAWSRFCQYKEPGSDHCQQDSYFKGRAASSRKVAEAYLGINIDGASARMASWWDDLESLVREYWSAQNVQVKRGRGKLIFKAKLSGTPRTVEIRGPVDKPTAYIGGASKTFNAKTSLKEIVWWIDATAQGLT